MKKFITLMLSAMLLTQSLASAATFPDMPEDPEMAVAIQNAVENGIIYGDDNGNVNPNNNIKRAEMAAIITRVCKVEKEGDISSFTDVDPDAWYYSSIAKAYEMGALSGDGNSMYPEKNITFQECFTVLSQVFDLIPEYKWPVYSPDDMPDNSMLVGQRLYDISPLVDFADVSEIANWALLPVCGVVVNGGWNGIDGKLTPNAYITRGQFAMVINNLIQNYIDEPGTYTELPEGHTMIRCESGVILDGVETDYDIYIGDSVAPSGIEIKDIKANKRFVVRGCATPTIDENGVTTFGETGITLSGYIYALRVIRPYISFDTVNATVDSKYGMPGTHIIYKAN